MKKQAKWQKEEVDEIDAILPFMSLLLVIIPVLLSNISFYHFRAIQVNTPSQAKSDDTPLEKMKPEKKKKKMITANVKMFQDTLKLQILDDDTAAVVKKFDFKPTIEGGKEAFKKLQKYKKDFPKLENVMVSIDGKLNYKAFMEVLNEFKQPLVTKEELKKQRALASTEEEKSKLNEKSTFKVVLLPEELKLEDKTK